MSKDAPRITGAVARRMHAWLSARGEGKLRLSRSDVEALLAEIGRQDAALIEWRERLEAAKDAYAAGGPEALAASLGLRPFDRRAAMSPEDKADLVVQYWYAVRNGRARAEAAQLLNEETQEAGNQRPRVEIPSETAINAEALHRIFKERHGRAPRREEAEALRGQLRRAFDELKREDSPIARTANGAIMQGILRTGRLTIPQGERD